MELCIVHTLCLSVARTECGLAMQSLVLAYSPKDTKAYERIGDATLYFDGEGEESWLQSAWLNAAEANALKIVCTSRIAEDYCRGVRRELRYA